MRLVDIDACDREQFYKDCGGKDSLISVEAVFDMLMVLPEVQLNKTDPVESLEEKISIETLRQVMAERDVAVEQLKELGYELGQKIEHSDDVISRENAIKCVLSSLFLAEASEKINKLPLVVSRN